MDVPYVLPQPKDRISLKSFASHEAAKSIQNYVAVSTAEPAKAFVQRNDGEKISPAQSLATVSIFINDITLRKPEAMEIICDPLTQPHFVQKLTSYVASLICVLLIIASVILGVVNYVYSFLANSFARDALLNIYTSSRGAATVWEFICISILLAIYSFWVSMYPDPKSWQINNTIRCNRIFRWIPFLLLLAYMVVIFCYLCYDIALIESKIEFAMNDTLYKNNHDMWDSTQSYFECCGIDGPNDWEGPLGSNLNCLLLKNKNKVKLFPSSCCNRKAGPCDFCPFKDESWESGCRSTQIYTAYVLLGITLALSLVMMAILFSMFFNMYVLEVLVLKVDLGPPPDQVGFVM